MWARIFVLALTYQSIKIEEKIKSVQRMSIRPLNPNPNQEKDA